MDRTLFILGAGGYVGRETVTEGLAAGWQVKALVRSPERAASLQQAGAQPIVGDVLQPRTWVAEARNARALIDLTLPKFPKRFTRPEMHRVVAERLSLTRRIVEGLLGLSESERPLLINVSGTDDLEPDARGRISHASPQSSRPRGFAPIGLPARRIAESSGLHATWVHFGLVYGPGGPFAEQFVDGLKRGRLRVLGSGTNRVALVHVTDAARAVIHLAGLPRQDVVGRTWVAIDAAGTTQHEFLSGIAELVGMKPPGSLPAWLAALVAGRPPVENITFDVNADNSALLETGFRFRYPSYREGLPPALEKLGFTPTVDYHDA